MFRHALPRRPTLPSVIAVAAVLFGSLTTSAQSTRSQITSHNPVEMIICRAKNTGATIGEINTGNSLEIKTSKSFT